MAMWKTMRATFRRSPVWKSVLLILGCWLGLPRTEGAEPTTDVVTVGARRELFVGDWLVERLQGLSFKLHEPREAAPSAATIRGAYMTVIHDGDLYRAYYRDYRPEYQGKMFDGNPGEITRYAESRDGVTWMYPELGFHEVQGSKKNNVLFADMPPFSHNFSPFRDERPGVPADERYKGLAGTMTSGLVAFASADGVHWRKWREEPVLRPIPDHYCFDSQNVAFWSVAEGKYVCYFRVFGTPSGEQVRSIARTTSADFSHWTEPVKVGPNLPGEHLYVSQTHPYFRAPHLYISLPTRFLPDRGDSTDILFMAAREGGPYVRLFPEAFIRPGLDPDRWGNRSNYAALNVVPTSDREMSIYHFMSGKRYVLRLDGFASLHAPFAGGECVTKPLVFEGRELHVNVSTAAAGQLQVELQTPAGEPIPGFGLADCPAMVGDHIDRVVRWKAGSDVSAWSGKPVRLRWVLKDADLFAFQFRD